MDLTPEEIERYAPYHTYHEFKWGFEDYNDCRYRELHDVAGQAYDRGAECAMRRGRAELRRMAELEREANGQFGVGA
jgi:hypothetical protein